MEILVLKDLIENLNQQNKIKILIPASPKHAHITWGDMEDFSGQKKSETFEG